MQDKIMTLVAQPSIKIVLTILSASMLFGLSWTVARGAYIEGSNNVFIILLTTFMRGATLAGFCFYKHHRLFVTKEDIKIGMQSGFIQSISIVGILGSMVYLPAPIAIIILFTSTLMLLFFLWIKREITINIWLLLTTLSCMFGISLVVDLWDASPSAHIVGYVLIAIGAVATASRMYIFGKLTQYKNPAVVGAETFLFAFLFLLLLPMLYKGPELPHSLLGYGWAFLSGLTASLATFAMFYGIAKVGSFHFSLYNKLEPVFGSIFSAFLIGEVLSFSQYVGMVVVIASLVTYQIWDYQQKQIKETHY